MIKEFFRDSFIYTIPGIVVNGIQFFLVPLFTQILSSEEYGAYDMLLIFSNIVMLTIAFEVSQGLARHYAEETNEKNKILYASSSLWFTILVNVVFVIIFLLFSESLSDLIIGAKGYEEFFSWGVVWIAINGIYYLIQNQFRWSFKAKDYAIVSILYAVLVGGLSLYLCLYLDYGLLGIIWAMLAASVICSLIGWYKLREIYQLKWSTEKLKEMLKYSLPLVPSSISVFISVYIDRIMINHYLDLSEVGLYGIGYRIASISGLVLIGFQSSLTPLIYKYYKDEATKGKLANLFRMFVGLTLFIFMFLSIFSKEIIVLFTNEGYYAASSIIIYLVPAVLLSRMYIFTPGIGIAKKTKVILYINIVGALINTLLNYLLIPNFGIIGASIATSLGYIIVFMMYIYYSQKYYRINHNWTKIILTTFLVFVITFFAMDIEFTRAINYLIKISLLLIFPLYLLVFGLVNKEEITEIILKAKGILVNVRN